MHPVRAEQELVAGQDFEVHGVDLDGFIDADGARDRVLVRGVGRLGQRLARDLAVADELVDERVILGELLRAALADHVDAAVAHVRDEAALAQQQERRDRGTHAALVGFLLAAIVDGHAGGLHGVFEHPEHVVRGHARLVTRVGLEDVAPAVDRGADLGDRDLRRDLARGVSAHAIGHHEERQLLVDQVVVLVVRALAPDVRCGPEAQIHGWRGVNYTDSLPGQVRHFSAHRAGSARRYPAKQNERAKGSRKRRLSTPDARPR